MSTELERLRAELDEINHQLTGLLIRRFTLLNKVFAFKKKAQLAIHDPAREQQIMAATAAQVGDHAAAPFILNVMQSTLSQGFNYLRRLWSQDQGRQLTALTGEFENSDMDKNNGEKPPLPLIYSCSGCSSAAQMANHIAVKADRENVAEMSCIAGVGGGVKPLVAKAKSGRKIVAVDGCPLKCCEHCLAQHGVQPDLHIVLSDYKVSKAYHQDFNSEQVVPIYEEIVEKIKVSQ